MGRYGLSRPPTDLSSEIVTNLLVGPRQIAKGFSDSEIYMFVFPPRFLKTLSLYFVVIVINGYANSLDILVTLSGPKSTDGSDGVKKHTKKKIPREQMTKQGYNSPINLSSELKPKV